MKLFLRPIIPIIGALVAPFLHAKEKSNQPNIIFILADDLGMQDVGFMGSGYFETPNLDALAKGSVVFNNAFMYPTCSPSRASLLTGKQSFRTRCYTVPVLERGKADDNIFSKWTVGTEYPVYSEPLNKAGYRLIHLGKWHIVGPDPKNEDAILAKGRKLSQPKNGNLTWLSEHKTKEIQKFYPTGRGFHQNVGGLWWGDPAKGFEKGYKAPSGGYIAPFKNPFIEEQQDSDQWLTDRLTTDAITFIKENKDKPFFVNLHYYAPHRPSVARDEESLKHFQNKPTDPKTGQNPKKKKELAAYATMVKSLDDNIKRLTDFLDQSGLRDNTIIIFTSDNGFNGLQSMTKNLRGAKGSVYDGGLRVPCLVNWKGTYPASKIDTPIFGLDFFPTFLNLAQVTDFTSTLDGTDISPLFEGKTIEERPLYWHIASQLKDPPCSIIREGDWKLIQYLLSGKVELYNTKLDQTESNNLAKTQPEKAAEMVAKLTAWREQHNVPLPKNSTLEK